MAAHRKSVSHLARQLFRLSLVDGAISPERVAGVLAYIEKHKPASPLALTKAYQRLVAAELAKSRAVIEHAGSISDATVQAIAATMSQRYGRPITASPKKQDALLAGVRVRVGDDVYESSVAGQLAGLAATV